MIFCILQVDFAITVITLFVVFNESFQKALVDKSVCFINIAHLIVFSSTKNPLVDVYFKQITALLAVSFSSAVTGPTFGLGRIFSKIQNKIVNFLESKVYTIKRRALLTGKYLNSDKIATAAFDLGTWDSDT